MPGEQEELRDLISRGVEAVARGDASSAIFSLIWANVEKALQTAQSRVQELEATASELLAAIDAPGYGIAAARREQAAVEKLRKLL